MDSNLVRWNPFREMSTIQRMFDDTWRQLAEQREFNGYSLPLDVHENDTSYTITTEVPGVTPENINIRLDGDVLTIEAEVEEQMREEKDARTLIRERRYGKFSRGVRLPQPVNADAVEATFDNGILHLELPKVPEVQPKKIAVKINSNNN